MGPNDDLSIPRTLLITLSGKDRPGVTSSVFATLARFGLEVLDVEQIVLKRRLVLGVLVTAPREWKHVRDAVERVGESLGMSVEVTKGGQERHQRWVQRTRVTVLGSPLKSKAMAAIAGRIADHGANIDRIQRMARYPVTAIELQISGADPDRLRHVLGAEAAAQGVDVAVQKASMLTRGARLIVMDVDSTLIQGEVIEMLAAHAGCESEVAKITEAAMRGELDFEQSLRARVALLKGVPAEALDEVYREIQLSPGAATLVRTLRRLGYRFALVSGGFSQITDRIARDLGINYSAANTLEIIDGHLSGNVVGTIIDRAGKAAALRRFAGDAGVSPEATVAIGDGANDLDMLAAAGLGIAFNAKPAVRASADTSLNVPYLDAVLFLLGLTREEVEAAAALRGAGRAH